MLLVLNVDVVMVDVGGGCRLLLLVVDVIVFGVGGSVFDVGLLVFWLLLLVVVKFVVMEGTVLVVVVLNSQQTFQFLIAIVFTILFNLCSVCHMVQNECFSLLGIKTGD